MAVTLGDLMETSEQSFCGQTLVTDVKEVWRQLRAHVFINFHVFTEVGISKTKKILYCRYLLNSLPPPRVFWSAPLLIQSKLCWRGPVFDQGFEQIALRSMTQFVAERNVVILEQSPRSCVSWLVLFPVTPLLFIWAWLIMVFWVSTPFAPWDILAAGMQYCLKITARPSGD